MAVATPVPPLASLRPQNSRQRNRHFCRSSNAYSQGYSTPVWATSAFLQHCRALLTSSSFRRPRRGSRGVCPQCISRGGRSASSGDRNGRKRSSSASGKAASKEQATPWKAGQEISGHFKVLNESESQTTRQEGKQDKVLTEEAGLFDIDTHTLQRHEGKAAREERGRKVRTQRSSDDADTPQILNYWWPLTHSSQVLPDRPTEVALFGEPLVLYRDSENQVVCAQDRCIHKSCPLSLGYVVDGRLTCGYHGWEYGKEGKLEHVPCLVNCPKAGVPTYPTQEVDNVIWVYPGDLSTIGNAPQPEKMILRSLKGAETLDWPGFEARREWNSTPWQSAIEITCDFTHLQFVHPGTQTGRAPLMVGGLHRFEASEEMPLPSPPPNTSELDDVELASNISKAMGEVLNNPEGSFVAEYVGASGRGGGRVTFIPPCTVLNETFLTDVDDTTKNGNRVVPLCFAFRFCPISPTRTLVLINARQNMFPNLPQFLTKVLLNMEKVMGQDQIVMAGQLLRMNQNSPQWPLPVESDRHLVYFSKWCESKGADHVWFGGYGNPSRVDEKIHRVSFKDALPDDREVIRNLQEERRRDAWPLSMGVPTWIADSFNSWRGSSVGQRIASGLEWAKGTWATEAEDENASKR